MSPGTRRWRNGRLCQDHAHDLSVIPDMLQECHGPCLALSHEDRAPGIDVGSEMYAKARVPYRDRPVGIVSPEYAKMALIRFLAMKMWFVDFYVCSMIAFSFFFSSRRRHTRFDCDWSSDVWSSD